MLLVIQKGDREAGLKKQEKGNERACICVRTEEERKKERKRGGGGGKGGEEVGEVVG